MLFTVIACGNPSKVSVVEIKRDAALSVDFNRKFSFNTDSLLHIYWDNFHKRSQYTGVTLIARNDSFFVWQKGEADSGKILDANMPMQIASISKTFCAAACMILIEKNKLRLSDTIQYYFPNFPYAKITIEQLLSHSSGLPEYTWFSDVYHASLSQRIRNRDVLEMLYKHKPESYFPPGKRHHYCNTNFILLTLIIEKISGLTYAEFLDKNIFKPLGMKTTKVLSADFNFKAMAVKGHLGNGKIFSEDYQDGTCGDKNILSTVFDLYRFYVGLQKNMLFNAESKAEMFRTRWVNARGNSDYALGWRKRTIHGETWLFHSGWWHGFRTNFYFSLSENKCAVTLCNRLSGGFVPGIVIASMFDVSELDKLLHPKIPFIVNSAPNVEE